MRSGLFRRCCPSADSSIEIAKVTKVVVIIIDALSGSILISKRIEFLLYWWRGRLWQVDVLESGQCNVWLIQVSFQVIKVERRHLSWCAEQILRTLRLTALHQHDICCED